MSAAGAGGIGAAVQGVTDVASSAASAALSLKLAKDARDHSINVYQHRYQWQMDDMRLAGLNPILAYRQSPGAGAAPVQGHMSSVARSNYVATARQGAMMKAEVFRTKQQGWQAAQQSALAQEQAVTVRRLREALVSSAKSAAAGARAGLPVKQADEAYYKTKPGQMMRFLQRTLQGLGGKGN